MLLYDPTPDLLRNLTRNRAAEREQRQQELTECQAKLDSCTRQMSDTTANLETLNERLSNITDEINGIKYVQTRKKLGSASYVTQTMSTAM